MGRSKASTSIAALLVVGSAGASRPGAGEIASALARIGDRVEHYYVRAESIVCLETVRLQPLALDFSPDGHARRLVYELRMAWAAQSHPGRPPEASVIRRLLTVDGRPPREKDEPGCMDPKPVSPDPLSMFLPGRRGEQIFSWAGFGRKDGRAAIMLDYKGVPSASSEVTWHEHCVSVSLPGRSEGRVWADAATADVLRLDERLKGLFEVRVPSEHRRAGGALWLTIERADTSIRYRAVTFRDPDETLMLPESIQSLTVIRGAGVPRLRTTQVFSDYKRFITGGRVVPPEDAR